MKQQRGFTLLEMMVVIVILGILAAMVVPNLIGNQEQAAKQKAFLTMAFGGPANYSGKDMREGHAKLVQMGLNDSHFDAVIENLAATLSELGVSAELIGQVAAIAQTTRADVLGK